MALMDEFKNAKVSVVVDAPFGHRIAKKESAEFEKAIANNELVAPPAGAVGRGDAFVLAIADKVNASILSNDSYQEFHGKYKWLFDEGRLIGGKPVPLVGWVFVERLPVRGSCVVGNFPSPPEFAADDSGGHQSLPEVRSRLPKEPPYLQPSLLPPHRRRPDHLRFRWNLNLVDS